MLFSENWLREWVDTDLDAAALGEKLTLAGLELEGIEPASALDLAGTNRDRLIVGRIVHAEPHPDADRLRVCNVDVGDGKTCTIVCGAPNAAVGLVAPVALPGARLPGMPAGKKITRSKIRGVQSEGMLCSGAELGISEEADGLMALPEEFRPGQLLADVLSLTDQVLDIDLTPNRGDCLSIQGIAREVSALTGAKMRSSDVEPVKPARGPTLAIDLQAPELCPRFVGRAVTGIDMAAPTPLWMKEKLRKSGIRSISAPVDITAYVMLETGQPMHAYDLDKLSGGIVVRRAEKKEKMALLDGSTVTLEENNLVIADHKKAIGLAGIMGGADTMISESTDNVFLEAAFFSPSGIIGKARQFGMHTDASHRFERGVNPEGQVAAIEMATALLTSICGGVAARVCHKVARKYLPKYPKITLQAAEIKRILGISVSSSTVTGILRRLGMTVEKVKGGWEIVAPPWRFDIDGEHDLVEEVGRCHGYEQIEPVMPRGQARRNGYPETRLELMTLRSTLTARGYYEAVNYSFIDGNLQRQLLECEPGIRLANPLADNMAEMRQSLLVGLLSSVEKNLNRQEDRVRLFELGNVFSRRGKKRQEKTTLAVVATGEARPVHWSDSPRPVDFHDLKGDVESLIDLTDQSHRLGFESAEHPAFHPGRCARIMIDRKEIGYLGQIHPTKQALFDIEQPVYAAELSLDGIMQRALPSFKSLSRYPAVQRDLAVVVDRSVVAGDLLAVVRAHAGDQLKRLRLFDIYTGERVESTKKSFAFSLTFQSESSNLKSADIEPLTDKIVTALRQDLGAELRS